MFRAWVWTVLGLLAVALVVLALLGIAGLFR